MNRLAHWMMRLYPTRRRKRYGDELDALLAVVLGVAGLLPGAAGLSLAALFSLFSGFGGWFGNRREGVVNPSY